MPQISLPAGNAKVSIPPTKPITLTATTNLTSGATKGVNAIALKNPHGLPMEIHEIKIQIVATGTATAVGSAIRVKLDLGNFPLTGGYVPIWAFGQSENIELEEFLTVSNVTRNAATYTWHLPKPLFVPPGATVVPTFQHAAQTAASFDVWISYSAQMYFGAGANYKPKTVHLPYVAAWTAKSFAIDSAGTDQSQETDLINTFDQPIMVQRFCGRLDYFYVAQDAHYDMFYNASVGSNPDQLFSLRMFDSQNDPIVRDFSNFYQVFGGTTRTWEVGNAILRPKSYYLVSLSKVSASTGQIIQLQPCVSFVGHRDVALSGF